MTLEELNAELDALAAIAVKHSMPIAFYEFFDPLNPDGVHFPAPIARTRSLSGAVLGTEQH